jgi:hypothetical protein
MSMKLHKKKYTTKLGFFAGTLMALFGRYANTSSKALKNIEFKNSTQKLGISFTDKIRDVFRNKWLKKN